MGRYSFTLIENRYLTPREYMRLHEYDDSYRLIGPIRSRVGAVKNLDQHRQIANSVPPRWSMCWERLYWRRPLSKIFELFGYRLDVWGAEAEANLRRAWCPFMDAECDGEGNRHQSAIDFAGNIALSRKIPGKSKIQCGVCSLQMQENEQPWIVCSRRLFSLKHGKMTIHQVGIRKKLATILAFPASSAYSVWPEVKMKANITSADDEDKSFDYTFDYVLAPTEHRKICDIASMLSMKPEDVEKLAERNKFTLIFRGNEKWIDDFPADPLTIIEVMTSSTSGGNKQKRTQIAMACEDAILHKDNHAGPGINYRQVWARMVSQLIAKSQVALAWGGSTIWLLQDVLADYISKSTALNLSKYLSDRLNEVNILAFGYGNIKSSTSGAPMALRNSSLYSGPILKVESAGSADGFVDIVKIGAPPQKEFILTSLLCKPPVWACKQ